MLSASVRFHGHGSLRYVYQHGSAVRSHLFTIKASTNPRRKKPRFAVVVSKKVHKSAVGRNRMRRRIYEVIRYAYPSFTRTCDVVVIVTSSEVLSLEHAELAAKLHDLFTEAKLQ